jgi:protein-L-isoaspartate(D-aspartate) O-methyltransferase
MVASVLKQTDRRLYCRVAFPYVDRPHSIGFAATISAPHMHAFALESLMDFIKPESRILDVGAGSGFLTTCFARLLNAQSADASGFVVGIEHHPKLVEFAVGNINSDDPKLIADGKIRIIQGDGRLGCEEHGPYDAIHVGAAAAEIPASLLQQLKVNGRMICPVGPAGDTQQLEQYDKTSSGEIIRKTLMSVVYVPLTDISA